MVCLSIAIYIMMPAYMQMHPNRTPNPIYNLTTSSPETPPWDTSDYQDA